jgi:hypothetical protein
MKQLLLTILAAIPLLAETPHPKPNVDVGLSSALAHIADGGQWTTTFTLVNLDTVPAPYTLDFYADDGSPLTLGLAGIGSVTTTSGVLPVNGSTVIQTTGGPVLSQGWAYLDTTQSVGAEAVFKSHVDGRADYEAAVAIDQGSTSIEIAFDNSGGYFTGVAIANTDSIFPANVTVTVYDPQGVQIGTGSFALQPSGHVSLLLNLSYPITAGLTGTVEFTSDNGSIVGLGLRFNPTGPFTSTTSFTLD